MLDFTFHHELPADAEPDKDQPTWWDEVVQCLGCEAGKNLMQTFGAKLGLPQNGVP
jgi:hypothetical protein